MENGTPCEPVAQGRKQLPFHKCLPNLGALAERIDRWLVVLSFVASGTEAILEPAQMGLIYLGGNSRRFRSRFVNPAHGPPLRQWKGRGRRKVTIVRIIAT